jgi:iron complex outermembrane receptor protein
VYTKLKTPFMYSALALAVGIASSPSWAQEDLLEEEASSGPASEEIANDGMEEQVTVTGSRIKRTEFTSSAPIEVITRERSVLAGLLSTTEILQGSTIAAGQQIDDSFSGYVTDGGPGANEISLRGLGGQRSLLLVNGKRWTPSGVRGSTHSVDLTAVPTSVTYRTEILKDGASSVYGADAVAGVVNVITRTAVDDFTVNFSAAVPELGSGNEYVVDALWGKTGSNWSFSIGGSFESQESIKQSELGYGNCETRPRLTDQDGDGTIDNRDPATGEDLCFGFIYGFAVSPFGWARYDGSLGPDADPSNPNFDADINGAFGIPYFTTVPETALDNSGEFYRDTRSPEIADAKSESDVFSLNSFGSLDFSIADRSATAYYEFFYNKRESTQNGGYHQFFPQVGPTNPYNPFGTNGPLAGFGGFTVIPVLPTYEMDRPEYNVDITRHQTFIGLKGDISSTWTYDAYIGYGHSDGTYRWDSFLSDRVSSSLDAVINESGDIVCADPSGGCVPANLFSEEAMLYGRLPADVTDYLIDETEGNTIYKGHSFSAFATGELFDLPSGTVSAVFGVEYRKETIDDQPDEEFVNGNIYGASAAGVTKGTDKVQEVYSELEIPILSGVPFADELTVNLSGRYTDYDSYGSDSTYRGTINWQVNSVLRLRGTQGTSFRAPDLFEQFLGDQTGFVDGFLDPCKRYTEDYEPGDVVYENCDSIAFPDGYFDGASSITTVTGGSDTLEAETSDSYTLGFVINPEEWGLAISMNMFDFKIENTVSSLSATSLLGLCYTSEGFSSPYCSRVGPRDPQTGDIEFIDASFINVGVQKQKGYDFDVLYEKEFSSFDLSIDTTLTYLNEFSEEILGEINDYEGHFAFPHWSGEMDVRVDWKDWNFFWTIDWIGKTDEGPVFDPGTENVDRVTSTGDEYYHTLATRWQKGNWTVVGTVRNVLDSEPPVVADGSGTLTAARVFNTLPGTGYPLFGRTFVMQIGYQF